MALCRLHLRKIRRMRAATKRAMSNPSRLHTYQRRGINAAYNLESQSSYDREHEAIAADMRAGRDPHTYAAARYTGLRPEAITRKMRQEAKARNFIHLYSINPPGIGGGLKKGEIGAMLAKGLGKSKIMLVEGNFSEIEARLAAVPGLSGTILPVKG